MNIWLIGVKSDRCAFGECAPVSQSSKPIINDGDSTMSELVALSRIPDLENAVEDVISFGSEYWTPENIGESKRGFVLGIEVQSHEKMDDVTGDLSMIDLPCVVFAEQENTGFKQWANGSIRLVAIVSDAVKSGALKYGKTPVQIKYTGKKKNKTNAFKSDNWDIRPLIIKAAE